MKRLVVFLIAGLVFGAAFATQVKSKYPAFAAVYTNVSSVEFFTASTAGGSAIGAASLTGYQPATASGLTTCVNGLLSTLGSSSNTYNINSGTTSPAPAVTCKFYPNAVTKSGFSVGGWSTLTTKPAATQPDDGELLVITNSPSSFTVTASISSTVAGGLTIKVIPGYLATDKNFYKPDQSTAVGPVAVGSLSVNQTYAFSTQYTFAKIIPITFFAESNPLTSSPQTTQQTATITWNGAAP